MARTIDSCPLVLKHQEHLRQALDEHAGAASVTAHAHAVADVMGGIGEDSGTLILTTTVDLSFVVSLWPTPGAQLRLQLIAADHGGAGRDAALPLAEVASAQALPRTILDRCLAEGAEWAAPICLAIQHCVAAGAIKQPAGGLMIVVHTDLPPDVEFGRQTVLAAATIRALVECAGASLDALTMSRLASSAVLPLVGVPSVRTAMTTLHGPLDNALLQLRFHPQPLCEALPMPAGVQLAIARTHLARPVTLDRLIDTHTCAQMGHRIICELQERAAQPGGGRAERLASVTPTEYVERYRDQLPSKISGKSYVAKFGEFRGLAGELDPQDTYKVRSRAEHHIYENRRVHDFATNISRARRSSAPEALLEAGELMYASHWSYSQRCGIGGVEADRFVSAVKQHGPNSLFGAKVTGTGAGGEMVVLLRDNEAGQSALQQAIREAEASSQRPIRIYRITRSPVSATQPAHQSSTAPVVATI